MKKGLLVLAIVGAIVSAGVGATLQAEFSPGPGPQGIIRLG